MPFFLFHAIASPFDHFSHLTFMQLLFCRKICKEGKELGFPSSLPSFHDYFDIYLCRLPEASTQYEHRSLRSDH